MQCTDTAEKQTPNEDATIHVISSNESMALLPAIFREADSYNTY